MNSCHRFCELLDWNRSPQFILTERISCHFLINIEWRRMLLSYRNFGYLRSFLNLCRYLASVYSRDLILYFHRDMVAGSRGNSCGHEYLLLFSLETARSHELWTSWRFLAVHGFGNGLLVMGHLLIVVADLIKELDLFAEVLTFQADWLEKVHVRWQFILRNLLRLI